jgi:hypothetical protein
MAGEYNDLATHLRCVLDDLSGDKI